MNAMPLDGRNRHMLETLLQSEQAVRSEELAESLNISVRSVYYGMDKINDWLSANGLHPVQHRRNAGFCLQDTDRAALRLLLAGEPSRDTTGYLFSPEERAAVLACLALVSKRQNNIQQFMDLFSVSRNTILGDLKTVRIQLEKHGMGLIWETGAGYHTTGGLIQRRAAFMDIMSGHLHLLRRRLISTLDYASIDRQLTRLTRVEQELDTEYVEGALLQLALLLESILAPSLVGATELPDLEQDEHLGIIGTDEHKAILRHFPDLPAPEQQYLAAHLLGTRVVRKRVAPQNPTWDLELYDMANQLISEFERLACIGFNGRNELLDRLQDHLRRAMYRYRYGISIGNPLEEEIIGRYPELFEITRQVADSITRRFGYRVSRGETAYLALHFGAHLRSTGNRSGVVRTVLVCPNGMATARMLKKELLDIIPFLEIVDIVSVRDLDQLSQLSDVIISTVDLPGSRKYIKVSPVLTEMDRKNLLNTFMRRQAPRSAKAEADRLFRIIADQIPSECHGAVLERLIAHFSLPHPVVTELGLRESEGFLDLLVPEHIRLLDRCPDWRTSIAEAAAPLLAAEDIEPRYVDAMVRCLETYGSYMFLTPDIVLLHATPQDGVNRLSLSMLLVREGVGFPGENHAHILLVLAPVDDEQHLRVLKEMSDRFTNPLCATALLQCGTPAAAHTLLANTGQA